MNRALKELAARESLQRYGQIEQFADNKGLRLTTFRELGRKLLMLDVPDFPSIDEGRTRQYLGESALFVTGGGENCHDIADRAVSRGIAVGKVYTPGNSQAFCGWHNHWINYDLLPDETAVALDFTAGVNVDYRQGRFDVLGLRAADLDALPWQVGELYGGIWTVETRVPL